tara:strand:+ start:1424 stop:1666 length:243 start_codon:yes stop_codon:yes gene_type:complete
MIIDISLEIGKMAFDDALKSTRFGDSIIYHVGPYAGGKHKHDALAASEGGMVALVQKKIHGRKKSQFQYIAQRSGKKFKK